MNETTTPNATNATNTPIHIKTQNLRLTAPLEDFIRKKAAAIPRIAADLIAMEITLARDPGASGAERFTASARLAVPGNDIHGSAVGADLYVIFGALVDRLARQVRKRKTRLARAFHSLAAPGAATLQTDDGGEENHGDAPEPRAVESIPPRSSAAAPASSVLKPKRREAGEEIRAFGFRRRAPFACAPEPRF